MKRISWKSVSWEINEWIEEGEWTEQSKRWEGEAEKMDVKKFHLTFEFYCQFIFLFYLAAFFFLWLWHSRIQIIQFKNIKLTPTPTDYGKFFTDLKNFTYSSTYLNWTQLKFPFFFLLFISEENCSQINQKEFKLKKIIFVVQSLERMMMRQQSRTQ